MLAAALTRRFGGLPRRFWMMWVGLLLNRAGVFVQPMLTFYLTEARGYTVADAAWVVSAYGGGQVVGTLLGGQLADRVGRRATILASAAGGCAGLLLLAEMRTLPAIALASFALAVAWDSHRPAIGAMVADIVPAPDRARAFALQYVAVNLGFALAPALAGQLVSAGYDLLFAAAAGVQALWFGFAYFALPETRGEATRAADNPDGLGTALGDRVYLAFLGLCLLVGLFVFQTTVSLPAWLLEQGHDAAAFGAVISLNGLMIVLVQPWISEWIGRRDASGVIVVAMVLYAIGFGLHGLGAALWWHGIAVLVWTSGEIIAAPVQSTIAATLAPPHARGRYQGLLGTSFAAAAMLGPPLGAQVMAARGGEALWLACLLTGLLGAGGALALGPALRRRLEAAR